MYHGVAPSPSAPSPRLWLRSDIRLVLSTFAEEGGGLSARLLRLKPHMPPPDLSLSLPPPFSTGLIGEDDTEPDSVVDALIEPEDVIVPDTLDAESVKLEDTVVEFPPMMTTVAALSRACPAPPISLSTIWRA